MHNLTKYRFKVEFEIPATYPSAPMEIILPELDGKTPKMYRGGKICMDIHFNNLIVECIKTFERVSSQIGKDIFICPTDYPYLYMNNEKTNVLIGNDRHWRTVNKTLCTFFTTKELLDKYWNNFEKNCSDRHDPFEKYLNQMYEKEICISPLKSLSIHMANINSSYGLSPFIDYKKIWDEN